jgi:3-deoxy-D-manno-octulosonic-acid transferase
MDQIILFAYAVGLVGALVFVGPFLLVSPRARAGLLQKLGFIPTALHTQLKRLNSPVWFHAVSVGEFNAAWPFIQAFHERYPKKQIVISTTTGTGQSLAAARAADIATIIYFPFDLPWIVSRWLLAVRPSMVAILETELWPCFTNACFQQKIPIVVLNGRISPKSHRLHRVLKPLFARLLRKFSLISVQSQGEAGRYRIIGGENLPISIDGNLKYDGLSAVSDAEIDQLKTQLNIDPSDLVLVAGSTHEGEEALILNVLANYRKSGHKNSPVLKVIIAPRHPERCQKVAELIEACGYTVRRHSKAEGFESDLDVLLIDTIGSLAKIYCVGSLAFIGGTIAKVGGHNLVEPYAYGVSVVCGPSLYKTKDTAQILYERKSLWIGANASEVTHQLLQLLENREMRAKMGVSGRLWLSQNQGAVRRAMKGIAPFVKTGERESLPESQQVATTKACLDTCVKG